MSKIIDLTVDEDLEEREQTGRKRKKKTAAVKDVVEGPVQKAAYSSRRRNSVFVNLVRTKNAESMSFKSFTADSDKALREMVGDMVEGEIYLI